MQRIWYQTAKHPLWELSTVLVKGSGVEVAGIVDHQLTMMVYLGVQLKMVQSVVYCVAEKLNIHLAVVFLFVEQPKTVQ